MDSIISGYALHEAGGRWFVDQSINTNAKFDEYVRSGFGSRTGPTVTKLLERLEKLYPAPESPGSPFRNTTQRVASYVADAGFNCHHRAIAQAYPGRTYTYQASLWSGTHYVDQFPSFYDPGGIGANIALSKMSSKPRPLQAFQSYLVSEVVAGNPNTFRDKDTTIEWPVAPDTSGPTIQKVLDFKGATGPSGFAIVPSQRLRKDRCEFWNDVWIELEKTSAGSPQA
jgi:hypothetical protein